MTGTDLGLFDTLEARAQYLEVTETSGVSEGAFAPVPTLTPAPYG